VQKPGGTTKSGQGRRLEGAGNSLQNHCVPILGHREEKSLRLRHRGGSAKRPRKNGTHQKRAEKDTKRLGEKPSFHCKKKKGGNSPLQTPNEKRGNLYQISPITTKTYYEGKRTGVDASKHMKAQNWSQGGGGAVKTNRCIREGLKKMRKKDRKGSGGEGPNTWY